MFVCHRCDTPACVNVDHLFLDTHAGNMADCGRKGRRATGLRHGSHTNPNRRARGAENGGAKLTAESVAELRRLRANGEKLASLAEKFGVAFQTISRIARGELWA